MHPGEVLPAIDAIELFQSYYDTHSVPADWNVRERLEFSDTVVTEAPPSDSSAAGGKTSTGRAPVAKGAAAQSTSRAKAHLISQP